MSSLVRRIQIKLMKARDDVVKVPNPFGYKFDTNAIDEKGKPILLPVLHWPRKVEGPLSPTNPKAKDLVARLKREKERK